MIMRSTFRSWDAGTRSSIPTLANIGEVGSGTLVVRIRFRLLMTPMAARLCSCAFRRSDVSCWHRKLDRTGRIPLHVEPQGLAGESVSARCYMGWRGSQFLHLLGERHCGRAVPVRFVRFGGADDPDPDVCDD